VHHQIHPTVAGRHLVAGHQFVYSDELGDNLKKYRHYDRNLVENKIILHGETFGLISNIITGSTKAKARDQQSSISICNESRGLDLKQDWEEAWQAA